MKKKIIIPAVAAALLLMVLATVLMARQKSSVDAVMYYLDKSETALVADHVSISYAQPMDIPENIINRLQKGKWGKKSPVPEDCKVNKISFDSSDSITVDMSKNFAGDNARLNILRTYALVKSVCSTSQFIGITNVKVTAGGKPIKATDGTALSYLSNASINVMNSSEVITYECELFFLDYASHTIKSERRKIDAANGTVEQNAVEALIAGPESKSLRKIFPGGTRLISAQTWDGVCYVNFRALPEADNMDIISACLKHTLSAFNNIKDIKILINGKDPYITQN